MTPYPWSLSDILNATGGRSVCADPAAAFQRVSTDSRHVSSGDLFIPIRGDRLDGHDFVGDAVQKGARGLLADARRADTFPLEAWIQMGVCCVVVPDTRQALGDLAAYNRKRRRLGVVGITGSNGKTSTRAMTSAVMETRYRTLSTAGNFNNDIGLPLTLLGLSPDHDWAVLEMGMNHPGEIRRLGRVARPDLGVITNIGPAHLEGVGSMEGVLRAKAELLEEFDTGGRAVLNADDPRLLALSRECACPVCLFGVSPAAAVRATGIEVRMDGVRFGLETPAGAIDIRLTTPARFMVPNALAAAAVGFLAGVSLEQIRDGLEAFRPVCGRMNIHNTARGILLIDDTYNANPASMKAAIGTLASLPVTGRRVLVAGDMLELGEDAGSLHYELGEYIAGSGIHALCAAGKHGKNLAQGAIHGGFRKDRVVLAELKEIADHLKDRLQPGDAVLIKGSRGMAMEAVLHELQAWGEALLETHP